MENEIKTLIDKYVLGTLTEIDQKQLEQEKVKNPNLDKVLAEHLDIYQGIQYASDQELIQVIKKIHSDEIDHLDSKNNRNLKKKGGITLLVIIILGLIFYGLWLKMNDSPNANKIYASNYALYMPSLQDRGGKSEEIVAQFDRFYKKKTFKEALVFISPYLENSTNEVKLVAAICAIEDNQISRSLSLLNEIILTNDYFFIDQARWYKAMAFLKLNQISEAKTELELLTQDKKADHYEASIKILEQIRRN